MFTKRPGVQHGVLASLLLLSELIHPYLVLPPSNQTTKEDSLTAVSMSTSAESQANVAAKLPGRTSERAVRRWTAPTPFRTMSVLRRLTMGQYDKTGQATVAAMQKIRGRSFQDEHQSSLTVRLWTVPTPSNRSFLSTTDQFLATCNRREMQSLYSTTCTRTRLASHELGWRQTNECLRARLRFPPNSDQWGL
jgi:hypothetical protein